MTAATTICGLMPMVVIAQTGEGIDYRPLAVVVLGGLTLTTLATPFAVPLAYSILDDLRHQMMGLWSRLLHRPARTVDSDLELPTNP